MTFPRLLFGERPFWWIGESRLFVNNQPKVHQFSSTCETGPGEKCTRKVLLTLYYFMVLNSFGCVSGSPSGHAMVTAAVWWVVVSSLGSFLYSRTRRLVKVKPNKDKVNLEAVESTSYTCSVVVASIPYLVYVVMLMAVGISRVFILAHFPHQVIAGSITGLDTETCSNHAAHIDTYRLTITRKPQRF